MSSTEYVFAGTLYDGGSLRGPETRIYHAPTDTWTSGPDFPGGNKWFTRGMHTPDGKV